MSITAVTFDAYGTLVRNDDLILIPKRIVADHGLRVSVEDVYRLWSDLYYAATQRSPFRTLRDIEHEVCGQLLQTFDVTADPAPYVDLFFELTTKVELYPEARDVLTALHPVPSAIISNADHEHIAAWNFTLPVQFILCSEAVCSYKPNGLVFQRASEQLGLRPEEVLHGGDSDVDDVKGAKAAGMKVAWVNRQGRRLRQDVPRPDFEIRDLTELPMLVAGD